MPRKQTVTVAELKSLILARFNANNRSSMKLQIRIQQELGNKVEEEKPDAIAIRTKLADWISDTVARRLKLNRRTIPLLSSRDCVQFVDSTISELVKVEDSELDAGEGKMISRFISIMFENLLEVVHAMVLPDREPYDEYWRWVTTVLNLASERHVLPTELLALEEVEDEITRRMFTKKQYVDINKQVLNKFVDIDVLKKIYIQPVLDMVAEGDEEEQRELEQEFETEVMPLLRETIKKTKVIINAWIDEEVERIYA